MTFLHTELVDVRLLVTLAAFHIPSVLALAAFSLLVAVFAFQLPVIGIKRCSFEVLSAFSASLFWRIPCVVVFSAFSLVFAADKLQLPLIGIKRCSLEVLSAFSASLRWWLAGCTEPFFGGILVQKISLLFTEVVERELFVTFKTFGVSSVRCGALFALLPVFLVHAPILGLRLRWSELSK